MKYPVGTVFVTESFDRRVPSKIVETLVIRIGSGGPEFRALNGEGRYSSKMSRFPKGRPLPYVCSNCHGNPKAAYEPPMMNFPDEPASSRIDFPDAYRHAGIVVTLSEAKHRGSGLFGPYGAIWLCHLRGEKRAGRLSKTDVRHYETLYRHSRLQDTSRSRVSRRTGGDEDGDVVCGYY